MLNAKDVAFFETTVEHCRKARKVYVHLTNAPALAQGRGRVTQSATVVSNGLNRATVRIDFNDDLKVIGVELDGVELP
jgi:hypothetical protein